MAQWKSVKARQLFKALERLGFKTRRQTGSHRYMAHGDGRWVTFAFHDGDEVGPPILAKIAKKTGLRPEDL